MASKAKPKLKIDIEFEGLIQVLAAYKKWNTYENHDLSVVLIWKMLLYRINLL